MKHTKLCAAWIAASKQIDRRALVECFAFWLYGSGGTYGVGLGLILFLLRNMGTFASDTMLGVKSFARSLPHCTLPPSIVLWRMCIREMSQRRARKAHAQTQAQAQSQDQTQPRLNFTEICQPRILQGNVLTSHVDREIFALRTSHFCVVATTLRLPQSSPSTAHKKGVRVARERRDK
eukprot:SAG11_NODE_1440_length_4905_cov_6.216188_3_plen_178_part_00